MTVLLSSVFASTSDFLKALSRNVQTTWRLACQQLSVHSARNQAVLADTNCKAPQRLEPQLARWAGDVTHTAHGPICNKLQEVHSSKLISIRLCHVIDFCKAALKTYATKNNYSQCTTPDPESSHHQQRVAANTNDDCTSRSHPARIIVAKLSSAKPRICTTSGSSCFNKYIW